MSSAPNALEQVVELNENAKALRRYAFEVSLSALGAIVRSSRAGSELRGFNEVAEQMRTWSRDLEAAVYHVYDLTGQSVCLVSDSVRKTRLAALLTKAGEAQPADSAIGVAAARERILIERLRDGLRRLDGRLSEILDGIAQLGMMASVLSRAALIEAASAGEHQRRELSIASKEFASYAESVNAAVTLVRARYRGKET